MPSSPTSRLDALAQLRAGAGVPRHVAIIMDGNGRWARARHLPRALGHRAGMKAVREVVEGAVQAGVEILSLFAFSQENWQRPAAEVGALMTLLEEFAEREAGELHARGVRVRVLGDLSRLATPARAAVDALMARTAGNARLLLNLFISYGGRAELVEAARALARDAAAGRICPESIDEHALGGRLYTAGCPDPDLLIRTSGEQRLSNFLLWQLAYTELVISPVLWPDFRREQLFEAVLDFQRRDRRYGRVPA